MHAKICYYHLDTKAVGTKSILNVPRFQIRIVWLGLVVPSKRCIFERFCDDHLSDPQSQFPRVVSITSVYRPTCPEICLDITFEESYPRKQFSMGCQIN